MIRRDVFDEVGGWDEGYTLNFSDLALCLAVHDAGYDVIYTPHARLLHHESATHKRRNQRTADVQRAMIQFKSWLQNGDLHYNPNLSYLTQIPTFNQGNFDHSSKLSPLSHTPIR
jgi:GT2 family glycosyltransferase